MSHLTSTSTTSSSSTTSANDNSNANYPLVKSDSNSNEFISNYLPQIIDPIEWQQKCPRKRKERQDSTSSITQDRKLVRSNSEEYLPTTDYEVIRRVSSHDNMKKSTHATLNDATIKDDTNKENSGRESNRDYVGAKTSKNEVQEILRETHRRTETSPARSRTFDFSHKLRVSPVRDAIVSERRDDSDSESEQRRSSERSCMARAVYSTRKLPKKSNAIAALPRQAISLECDSTKSIVTKEEIESHEPVYKYDLKAMKSERRGFSSKAKKNVSANSVNFKVNDDEVSSSISENTEKVRRHEHKANSEKQLLDLEVPWHRSQEDETPVICERFAEFENYSREVAQKMRNEPLPVANERFSKVETMKNAPNANIFISPDEKLNQINKRLTALKKRLAVLEDNFERDYGYRPSPTAKLNDRSMKSVSAEIHKLRKEKQALKADPMAAVAYKTTQPGDSWQNKIQKMQETIAEIEKVNTIWHFVVAIYFNSNSNYSRIQHWLTSISRHVNNIC